MALSRRAPTPIPALAVPRPPTLHHVAHHQAPPDPHQSLCRHPHRHAQRAAHAAAAPTQEKSSVSSEYAAHDSPPTPPPSSDPQPHSHPHPHALRRPHVCALSPLSPSGKCLSSSIW